jgi:E3 ubiquitin-protein ligase HUWE1
MKSLHVPPGEDLEVSVSRRGALVESLDLLNGSADDLRRGLNTVVFSGEKAYGSGMIRDWFTEVAHQLVDPSLHLFKLSPEKPNYLLINPLSINENPRYRAFYRATGRLMALALTSQQLVGLNFPVMFYAAMLDVEIDLEDIKEDEPILYESFIYVLNEVETKDEYSIVIQGVEHPITTENKGYMVRKKVNSLIPQDSREFLELIWSGFNDVLPIAYVREHFNPKQLKDLIMGRPYINIEELVKSVDFSDSRYTAESIQIKWLWDVLRRFDQDKRRAFIHFVTGSTQIPSGGFSRMPRRINIKTMEQNDALPQASNCFNTLYLPRYATRNILEKKLFKALELSDEMEDK